MRRRVRDVRGVALALLAGACVPRLTPLSGSVSTASVPVTTLPAGHRHVVFRWLLDDPDFAGRGDGAARQAWPDSVRVDFFLAGGTGSGSVVLIDSDLRFPSTSDPLSRRLTPPPPMLWAAFGRSVVPALRDTAIRVDGDTLRADIGNPVAWRLTFARDSLVRVEHVAGQRVVEWVARYPGGRVRYANERSRRQLELTIIRADRAHAFDASIWTLP